MQLRNSEKTPFPKIRRHIFSPITLASTMVLVAFLSLATLHLRSAAPPNPANPQPLWEIDLAKYGYQGRPPVKLSNADNWGGATYNQGVVFTDSETLAAYFVVHEDPPGATADRKPLPTDSYRLVVVFFNSATHEFIKKMSWIMPGNDQYVSPANFFPATNGRFIVRYGDILAVYSSSFKCITWRKIGYGIDIIASPAGDTLLLLETRQADGRWTQKLEMVETDRLATVKSWTTTPDHRVDALWGEQIVARNRSSTSIQRLDADPRPWFGSDVGAPTFLSPDTLAVLSGGAVQNVMAVSTDGKVLRKFDLGLEQSSGSIVGSRDGHRYAVPTMRWGVGRNNIPDVVHARVFSLDSDAPILTLDVSHLTNGGSDFFPPYIDTQSGGGPLALSSDGLLLAVKSGGIVRLYSVPASGSLPQSEAATHATPPAQPPDLQAIYTGPSQPPAPLVEQALSWLPADTESVSAANGPLPFPDLTSDDDSPADANTPQNSGSVDEAREIRNTFQSLPFSIFGFKKGVFGKSFAGHNFLVAIEGARNFGTPGGLGIGPYQGCDIVVFDQDVAASASAFLKSSAEALLKTEQIEGRTVTVFQEKLEEDIWTTYVTFPKPNIALAATSETYLREILRRIDGKTGPRALPETLPEWKYADTHAEIWALRHFDRKGMKTDPSSPFWGENSQSVADKQAIGFTFKFNPSTSHTASLVYLSENKDIRQAFEKFFSSGSAEPGAREMNARYQQLAPGVIQASADLDHIESARLVTLLFMDILGHTPFI
jgi:hypothetical protein